MKQKMLVIVGPTASGKSALAVRLAKKFGGEVISADSRQVYKGLDIGTGKITRREMKGVRHHLLDVYPPKKVFSAGEYVKRGRRAVDNVAKRGKLPIIVGGTGFYIDALVGRVALPEVAPDATFRKKAVKKTAAALFAELKKLDPARAKALSSPSERNNRARIIRALEIVRALGKSARLPSRALYHTLWIGIKPGDMELRGRINKRLTVRLSAGMVAEAKRLHCAGLSYRRMEELGLEYRSLANFLQNKISREELEKQLRSVIWRYARKQLGYWKRNKEIYWFKPGARHVIPLIKTWLKKSF